MTSFLSTVIQDLLNQHQEISNFSFILPSKRAGAFLKREISKQIKNPVFSPEVFSIEEFSEKISGLTTLDNISAQFEFYSVYKELTSEEQLEDFETFSNWAQTLIHDFNEIDRYLIPPDSIFNYLAEIQDINHWSTTPDKTELVKNYLAFWEKLPFYYKALKKKLLAEGIGYQGLVYKEAAGKIDGFVDQNPSNYIFLGFNALNKAEQHIVQQMLEKGARIYWDIDEIHLNDPDHDVSLFIREYFSTWPYYQTHPLQTISNSFNTTKNIEIAGIPKNIGQANYVGEILENISPEELSSTAIVLGDESLLVPVLNSLPNNLQAVNITMGLPLKYSPFSALWEMIFQLYKAEKNTYYFKNVISVLSNPIIQKLSNNTSSEVILKIKEKNLLYLDNQQISVLFKGNFQSIIDSLFPQDKLTPEIAIQRIFTLTKELNHHFNKKNEHIKLEFLYHYHLVFQQLQELLKKYPYINSITTLHNFFKELVNLQGLDFKGKPFQGLQLMGMLESRVLDFETVIVTSVDEGTLPAGKSNNSFIPYELKKTYQLPTYKEKDAVYTYHFYHLLQRAKKIYLLHNVDNESQMGGEKSRFLVQLEIEKQPYHNITSKIITPEVPKISSDLQEIIKTPAVIERLRELAEKGFSPSALTTYIRNPLDFYRQYILNIRDKDEVEETVAYNTLGTVVHDTLEAFYMPLEGQLLTLEILQDLKKRTEEEIKFQFEKTYSKVPLATGKNLLIFEVAKRYVNNLLKMEMNELKSGKVIKIQKIETDLTSNLKIEKIDFKIKLRGKVDRVDLENGVLRIIDYKTGKVLQNQLEIIGWNALTTDYDKYAKPFQVLMYATMLLENYPTNQPVEAGVISFKNLKEGFLKFGKKEHSYDKNKICQIDTSTLENFKEQLKKLIIEICDPEIPFIEKEIKSAYGNY